MTSKDDLITHLLSGATTTCHAWLVTRKDGQAFGFTDHDEDLSFEDIIFKAGSGLTAGALQLSTGLSVDNSEVSGALVSDGITEMDLAAGRFDGAAITTWLVNWQSINQRVIRFRGHFGEIHRSARAFKVELRGLTDVLSQQKGHVYQANCTAVLGDHECQFNLDQRGFSLETSVKSIVIEGQYILKSQPDLPTQWFERGRAIITSGRAQGLYGIVKFDKEADGTRIITLWVDFDLTPEIGDLIRLEAGCDKLAQTCRSKFENFLNYRGFPNIPSSDWIASYPVSNQRNNGGSRQS